MLENKEELLDEVSQYFTVKPTDKNKVYKLYIADQCVGSLTLIVKKTIFIAMFDANFNYEGMPHALYSIASDDNSKLEKMAKGFYEYCLLNRASSSYLHDYEENK